MIIIKITYNIIEDNYKNNTKYLTNIITEKVLNIINFMNLNNLKEDDLLE